MQKLKMKIKPKRNANKMEKLAKNDLNEKIMQNP